MKRLFIVCMILRSVLPQCTEELRGRIGGSRLMQESSESAAECCEMCTNVVECVAWTYSPSGNDCILRRSMGSVSSRRGWIYGYFVGDDTSTASPTSTDSPAPESPQGCSGNEWECDNGECIRGEYECDNYVDCADESDEANCSDTAQNQPDDDNAGPDTTQTPTNTEDGLQKVSISVENLAPEFGNGLSPFWVGFHDGSFDLYDVGEPATPGLSLLSQNGDSSVLQAEFKDWCSECVQDVIGADHEGLGPGAQEVLDVYLDPNSRNSLFMSYASMVGPSNDAFIGNENPHGCGILQSTMMGGVFQMLTKEILGSDVKDAGAKVNDEWLINLNGGNMNTLGFEENGVVEPHPGYDRSGSPGTVQASQNYRNVDMRSNYTLARIIVSPDKGIEDDNDDTPFVMINMG